MENIGEVLSRLEGGRAGDADGTAGSEPGTGGPNCERCGDRGWYTVEVPVSHPDFGRVVDCDCQIGRAEREGHERLVRYSNLGRLSRLRLDDMEPTGGWDREAAALFAEAVESAAAFADSPAGWLVLVGPHGSGKTRIAAAVANRCIERGHVALFVHVPDLMDHLRASFGPTSEITYSELFDRVRSTPLLILDDIGATGSSPWALQKLQQIVNHRFNEELPTVFTTAVEMRSLDSYLRARIETPGLSRILSIRQPSEVADRWRVLPEDSAKMTFETFDVRGHHASGKEQESLRLALEYSKGFPDMLGKWLTLHGPTGVGKTHLAVAIATECEKRGRRVLFAFVPALLDHLRSSFGPSSAVNYEEEFDRVRNAEVLILDDFYTREREVTGLQGREHTQGQLATRERASVWADEQLYQIIVHRHSHRLPTVITTSESFAPRRRSGSFRGPRQSAATAEAEAANEEKFDENLGPIRSRANDKAVGQVVAMRAPDYRAKARR